MGIFKRISDIIAANFNDMIEKHEHPEQMLRQAIREMEEAIAKARPDVAKAMANEKIVAKELAGNEGQVTAWTSRATTAVQAGDDALARKALERKLEYEKIVAALRDQHTASKEAASMLRRQLEAMEAKLVDAQRRLSTLAARSRAAEIRSKLATTDKCVELDQGNAFAKFEQLSRKVENAEAEAEAYAELARGRRVQDQDEDLEAFEEPKENVEDELAKLKEQLKK